MQTVWLYDSHASPTINIRRSFSDNSQVPIYGVCSFFFRHYLGFYKCSPQLRQTEVVCHFQQQQWFQSNIILHPCVPFTVASGAFVFLIPHHKENLFRLSRNPAYTYLLLGTFFFFFIRSLKSLPLSSNTRGEWWKWGRWHCFSDMDVRLKDKSVGWILSCQ